MRDFSAVTAACMMMRMAVFEDLGGFDEQFAIGFNDVDICLRAREVGLKVLYDGDTVLFHYESATRSQTKQVAHPEDVERLLTRHAAILRDGDPFYNPNLSYVTQDHMLREDTGGKLFRQRVTALDQPARRIPNPPVKTSPPPSTVVQMDRPAPANFAKRRGARKPAMASHSA